MNAIFKLILLIIILVNVYAKLNIYECGVPADSNALSPDMTLEKVTSCDQYGKKCLTCDGNYCQIIKNRITTFGIKFTPKSISTKAHLHMRVQLKVGKRLVQEEFTYDGLNNDITDPNNMNGHINGAIKAKTPLAFTYKFFVGILVPTALMNMTVKIDGDMGPLACGILRGEFKDEPASY